MGILVLGKDRITALVIRDGKPLFQKEYAIFLEVDSVSEDNILNLIKMMNKAVMDVRLQGADDVKGLVAENFTAMTNYEEVLKRLNERNGVEFQLWSQEELDEFLKSTNF